MRLPLPFVAALALWLVAVPGHAARQAEEPIAYVGHGAFFGQDGKQIQLSVRFVEQAQQWYRRELSAPLSDSLKRELASLEREWLEKAPAQPQSRLLVQQRALEWLVDHSPDRKNDAKLRSKVSALRAALSRPLPE